MLSICISFCSLAYVYHIFIKKSFASLNVHKSQEMLQTLKLQDGILPAKEK